MSSSLDNIGIGLPALLEYLRSNQQFGQQSGGAPLTPFNQQMLQQANQPEFDLMGALEQAQSVPGPRRGFSENFAQALAGMQFAPPSNFGEGLVQGLARGFSGATTQRQATAEEKVESRRKAASELAKARWERVNEEKDSARKALQQSALEGQKQTGREDLLTERARMNNDAAMQRLLLSLGASSDRLNKTLAARTGALQPQSEIEAWAQEINSGTKDITNVPYNQRSRVNAFMVMNGMDTTPRKMREVLSTLSAAESVVDQIESFSKTINKGGAAQRIAQFPGKATQIALQSDPELVAYNAAREGFLSIMSRAFGERGVLTDQDVARARKLVPSPFDTKEKAERNIAQLREFFASQKSKANKAWAMPNPADAVGAPSGGQVEDWVIDSKTGRLVPKR